MPKFDANTERQIPSFFVNNNLVSHALAEFLENKGRLTEEHLSRAEVLLGRVASDFAALADIYFDDDRNVYCDVSDILEGFGLLSLRFCAGRQPEDDYFLIDNYMELDSSVHIYDLYSLGEALNEIIEMAQIALVSFREFRTSRTAPVRDSN